jgi:hypothetical protein
MDQLEGRLDAIERHCSNPSHWDDISMSKFGVEFQGTEICYDFGTVYYDDVEDKQAREIDFVDTDGPRCINQDETPQFYSHSSIRVNIISNFNAVKLCSVHSMPRGTSSSEV